MAYLHGENLRLFDGLTAATDKLPFFSSSTVISLADFTAAGRALVDDANAAAQRTTLGLGTIAVQNTINGGDWSGTDLAIGDGGTGSSTASDARDALGLTIGTDVQAFDVVLDDHPSDLGHLAVLPSRAGEAESVAPDDNPGLEHDTIANDAPLAKHNAGVNCPVGTHRDIRVECHIRM